MVIAGPRSFGTGAACLAATRPGLIKEIRNRLPQVELASTEKTVWALVEGRPQPLQTPEQGRLTEDNVRIVDAGVFA
jgi:hypothetical protein